MTHRELKKQALALLRSDDFNGALQTLIQFHPRRIVNPLFGLLYHGEPIIRWRAVSAMGAVVSRLADENMESARVIMRRFMWNLNDESGGIGWGSPESLGEIMALHDKLSREFGCILISYADPEGNFLEHPTLQQGVLWAWGRLGRSRPELMEPRANLLAPYLRSDDVCLQGLAAWAAEALTATALKEPLKALISSSEKVTIYSDHELTSYRVGQLAKAALSNINQ
ncbi:MAG: hypothetical protein PVH87_12740 [Desulfobacteraceae bacterium]|jgi:hypothetical protein